MREHIGQRIGDIAERTRRRITRRLMPFLFVLYVLNYINRVNIGYASLQMTSDLGFSNTVFGFGAGIFFIGYFLLQIPATLLTEKWSARKFITVSLIVWGALAAVAASSTPRSSSTGSASSSASRKRRSFQASSSISRTGSATQDRGKAVALFMMAIPMSNMIGAVIAASLMRIDWFGYNGWRWLLILEGLPTVIVGVVTFFYLTDRPKDAGWLPEDERRWITAELEREAGAKKGLIKARHARRRSGTRSVILLALACFCYITNSVGLSAWLPTIVRRISGLSTDPGDPHLRDSVAVRDPDDARHGVALGQDAPSVAGTPPLPSSVVGVALSLSIAAGNQSRAGNRGVLARDDGALFLPVSVLGAADDVSERPSGGGKHRAHQFDRKPRRFRGTVHDRLPRRSNRRLHRWNLVSGGERGGWQHACAVAAAHET